MADTLLFDDDDKLDDQIKRAQQEESEAKGNLKNLLREKARREAVKLNNPVFSVSDLDGLIKKFKKVKDEYQSELNLINSYGGPEAGSLKPSEHNELMIKKTKMLIKMVVEDLRETAF